MRLMSKSRYISVLWLICGFMIPCGHILANMLYGFTIYRLFWGGKYYYMAAPFIGAANIIIWLYQRPVGDLDHLVWPIKKISSTIPANICCLLSIKVGHHLWLIYGYQISKRFPQQIQQTYAVC